MGTDPMFDPVGTVRQRQQPMKAVVVKTTMVDRPWTAINATYTAPDQEQTLLSYANEDVADWPVIGIVPGTFGAA